MKESIFEKNKGKKSKLFKGNDKLNELLKELKILLAPIQREKENEFKENQLPLGFIIGCPRSGTTLFLQWIAFLNIFSYPTNLLTRFAYAPYIGVLIQEMLFDQNYDFHGEFEDIQSEINFESNLGISKGALATNEFQHFFRNYMNNFDPEYLDNIEINKVDFQSMCKGFATIEKAFGKPFVTKAIMLQYNLNNLYDAIPNSIFIFIKRKPIYNMQSLLLSRKKYYNDKNIWWSVKPKEYEFLKDMDIYHQIAGQVYYTNKSIESELSVIPPQNQITIKYEQFCQNPGLFYDKIAEKYKKNGYGIKKAYDNSIVFENRNELKISSDELKLFEKAFDDFQSN